MADDDGYKESVVACGQVAHLIESFTNRKRVKEASLKILPSDIVFCATDHHQQCLLIITLRVISM